MGYNLCIEAAGVPVLEYHEVGSYQGQWYALTAQGFYHGSYGSCSGCDWREGEINYSDDEAHIKAVDTAIGREILKAKPLTLDELFPVIAENEYCDEEREEAKQWAVKVWKAHSKRIGGNTK